MDINLALLRESETRAVVEATLSNGNVVYLLTIDVNNGLTRHIIPSSIDGFSSLTRHRRIALNE